MLYSEKKYGDGKYIGREMAIGEYLNATDLIKISESILRLSKIAEYCGYTNANVDEIKEDWKRKDFLTLKSVETLVNTINFLSKNIFGIEYAIYEKRLRREHVESWIIVLEDLEKYLTDIAHQWRYCGMMKCGEGGGLLGI